MGTIASIMFYLCTSLAFFCRANALDPSFAERSNFTWNTVDRIIKQIVDYVVKPHLSDFMKFALEVNISDACQGAAFQTMLGLRNSDGWAIKMLDTTGKLPSGVLDGAVMDFGSYDECLEIKSNFSSSKDHQQEDFIGQYCLVGFRTPLLSSLDMKTENGHSYEQVYGKHPDWMDEILTKGDKYLKKIRFWFGVCMPSVCEKQDLQKTLGAISKPYGFTVQILDCHQNLPVQWTKYQTAAVSLLLGVAIIVALGTLLDILARNMTGKILNTLHTSKLVQMFRAFSAYTNTELFLKSSKFPDKMDCFNGVRFFSATWIILGHTYFFTDTWKYLKFRRLMGVSRSFNGQFAAAVIENFTIPVGSFFFMSGFLMTYTNWRKLEESKGKINILKFFIHKYWRMTPALIATTALFFAMPLLASGPLWNSTLDPPTHACENTWWANLFYIQNWWNADDFCLLHSWYLATLMQVHMIAVIILLLIYRFPLAGFIAVFIIFAGCTVLSGILVAWNDFPMPAPGLVKDLDAMVDYISLIYIKPYTHISTYIIGMMFGYIVPKYYDKGMSLSFQVFGWLFAIMCGVVSVYGIYMPSPSTEIRAVYISLHRISWALAIGWLTFCCAAGRGGVVNRILSWSALQPLGKLSYLAYLLHPLVLWYKTASLRERIYFGHTELVYSFLAHVVVSFSLAYVCYITVELPCLSLEKMTFSLCRSSTFEVGPSKNKSLSANVETLSVKHAVP